jgi:hypothetical protein
MPKGKRWSIEGEKKLKQLVDEGRSVKEIAAAFEKSEGSIRQKLRRLGLEVVVKTPLPPTCTTTTTAKLEAKGLIPVQKALELLATALNNAVEPGLNSVEIQRLNAVATLARTYENLFARFMQYREIEKRVVELEAKYARLAEERS